LYQEKSGNPGREVESTEVFLKSFSSSHSKIFFFGVSRQKFTKTLTPTNSKKTRPPYKSSKFALGQNVRNKNAP
jgi:hypothetical protein